MDSRRPRCWRSKATETPCTPLYIKGRSQFNRPCRGVVGGHHLRQSSHGSCTAPVHAFRGVQSAHDMARRHSTCSVKAFTTIKEYLRGPSPKRLSGVSVLISCGRFNRQSKLWAVLRPPNMHTLKPHPLRSLMLTGIY